MARNNATLGFAIAMALVGQSAQGSGFALTEQSASSLGTAFAGAASAAEDASTIYFNPAGMTKLRGRQLSVAGHLIVPSAKFSGAGASILARDLGANTGGDAGELGLVPNFYYVDDLGSNLKFGLGVNAPFGLATKYDSDWMGRYHAIDSEVMSLNINPSLAWQASEHISIGGGLNIQYLKATLSSAIDYATITDLAIIRAGGVPLGLAPGTLDGLSKVTGDDIGLGWNLGALLDITEQTRVGIHYRSQIEFNLKGDADFTVPAAATALATGLGHADGGASADLTTPDSLSLSLHHQVNDRLALMADVTRTGWETLDEIRIRFDNGADDSVVTTQWNNNWRFSLGGSYKANSRLTWRAGVALDKTAVPNAANRTPRIPDEDRTWLAVGFNYKYSDDLSLDLGYAHLWADKAAVNKATDPTDPNNENNPRGDLVGSFDSHADILSAQLNWRF